MSQQYEEKTSDDTIPVFDTLENTHLPGLDSFDPKKVEQIIFYKVYWQRNSKNIGA